MSKPFTLSIFDDMRKNACSHFIRVSIETTSKIPMQFNIFAPRDRKRREARAFVKRNSIKN